MTVNVLESAHQVWDKGQKTQGIGNSGRRHIASHPALHPGVKRMSLATARLATDASQFFLKPKLIQMGKSATVQDNFLELEGHRSTADAGEICAMR